MASVAVIGGTGMNEWPGLVVQKRLQIDTPYGAPSAPLLQGIDAGLYAQSRLSPPEAPQAMLDYQAGRLALERGDAAIRQGALISAA